MCLRAKIDRRCAGQWLRGRWGGGGWWRAAVASPPLLHGGRGGKGRQPICGSSELHCAAAGVAEGLSKDAFFFDFAGFENLCGILELISELVFPNL